MPHVKDFCDLCFKQIKYEEIAFYPPSDSDFKQVHLRCHEKVMRIKERVLLNYKINKHLGLGHFTPRDTLWAI